VKSLQHYFLIIYAQALKRIHALLSAIRKHTTVFGLFFGHPGRLDRVHLVRLLTFWTFASHNAVLSFLELISQSFAMSFHFAYFQISLPGRSHFV